MSYQYGGWQPYEANIFGAIAPHPHEDAEYHHDEFCADYLQGHKDEPQLSGHTRSMSAGVIPVLGLNQNFAMPSQPSMLQDSNFFSNNFVNSSFSSPLDNNDDHVSPNEFNAALDANSPIANDDAESMACSSNCDDCPSRCSEGGTACYVAGCGAACTEPDCEDNASPCDDPDCVDNNTADIEEAAGVLASFPHDVDTHMPGMAPAQYLTPFNGMIAPDPMSNMMPDYNNSNNNSSSSSSNNNNGTMGSMDMAPFMHLMEQHIHPMIGSGQPFCAHEPCNYIPLTCPLPSMRAEMEHGLYCQGEVPYPQCGVQFGSPSAIMEHLQQHNWPAYTGYLQQNNYLEDNDIPCGLPSSQTPASTSSTAPTSPNTAAADVDHSTPMSEATEASSNRPTNKTAESICQWIVDGVPCNQQCSNGESLQNHFREVHLKSIVKTFTPGKDVGGFICQWANCRREKEDFSQKSKLDRHLQTHTGFKPVKCDLCGTNLSAKQSLDQHMRTHTGQKPWRCTFENCTMAFKQQSALTMHTRTHTGEKPLKCETCGKAFGESSNLSKHRKTHNIKGSFMCPICGKDFHRQDQQRRHVKTHEKNQKNAQASGSSAGPSPPQPIRKMDQSRIKKSSK